MEHEQNTNERQQPRLTLLKGRNEEHLTNLIRDGIKVDAVVMDPPYCSGGSTGEACARLGLSFIGIEKNEAYFNTCKERLEPLFANCQGGKLEKNNN